MNPYVALAKQAVTLYITTGERLAVTEQMPAVLRSERAGVFVTLYKDGALRGCIGTLAPTEASLAAEIIYCSIQAASRDPRFAPVTVDELPLLQYSVDVLGEPEHILDKSSLDPQIYGVIVTDGPRRGVLLPDLPGVDTVEEQVAIALRKAGIPLHGTYDIARFSVHRYAEEV